MRIANCLTWGFLVDASELHYFTELGNFILGSEVDSYGEGIAKGFEVNLKSPK